MTFPLRNRYTTDTSFPLLKHKTIWKTVSLIVSDSLPVLIQVKTNKSR